jgi:hypothetical protein
MRHIALVFAALLCISSGIATMCWLMVHVPPADMAQYGLLDFASPVTMWIAGWILIGVGVIVWRASEALD